MSSTWIVVLIAGVSWCQADAKTPAADEPALATPSEYVPETPGILIVESEPLPRWAFGADYILWWLREGRLPATLTTSSEASQGLLGQPDTRVLYGGDRLQTRHDDKFNGIRFNAGYWFDDAQSLGIEASAFFLERDSTYFKAISDGTVLLARPYFLPDGTPASAIIAGDALGGPRSGALVGYSRIELFGQEINAASPIYAQDLFRVDILAGARFLQMRDRTDLTASGEALQGATTVFGLEDHYRAANAYYGGQIGMRGTATLGRWSFELRGEIGLGGNDEQVRAFGTSIYQTPSERIVTPVGLTVQASNTGTFDRAAVNMVGEIEFNAGFRLTQHAQFVAGYTSMLWDGVIRSGDQVDVVINPAAGTPPPRPAIPFKSDLFWAQGLNLGMRFSW
jgi:hypothetical protein